MRSKVLNVARESDEEHDNGEFGQQADRGGVNSRRSCASYSRSAPAV
jgi:hypothetical protein